MSEYQSIGCGLHEQYQYAVIKKYRLALHWFDASGKEFKAEVLPVDVITREKAEYLRVEIGQQETIDIRLDRIQAAYRVQGDIPLV